MRSFWFWKRSPEPLLGSFLDVQWNLQNPNSRVVSGIFATFCRTLKLLAVQNILMCKKTLSARVSAKVWKTPSTIPCQVITAQIRSSGTSSSNSALTHVCHSCRETSFQTIWRQTTMIVHTLALLTSTTRLYRRYSGPCRHRRHPHAGASARAEVVQTQSSIPAPPWRVLDNADSSTRASSFLFCNQQVRRISHKSPSRQRMAARRTSACRSRHMV